MQSVREMLSELYGQPFGDLDGGFLVKETPTHFISVHRRIFNWRLGRTPKDSPNYYDRAYCYYGTDFVTLLRAVGAAVEWDGADDTEPEGFDKNDITGDYAAGGNAWDPL